MKTGLENRLNKVEKKIEKILNPYYDQNMIIVVIVDRGETPEQKLAEKEKELGCKINEKKVLFFCISGITEF